MTEETSVSTLDARSGKLHPLASVVVAACAAFVLFHVGGRLLYGIGGNFPPAVQDGIDEMLRRSAGIMFLGFTRIAWNAVAPLALVALLFARRHWVVRRVGGQHGLRSAWHAVFWLQNQPGQPSSQFSTQFSKSRSRNFWISPSVSISPSRR